MLIFLYFLNHLNLPAPFHVYMSSKHQNINFTVEQENVGSLSFLDVNICCKNCKFVKMFTENLHLVEFSPIMKVSF